MDIQNIDVKNISIYNFVEILNSKGIIRDYLKNTPEVEIDYFSEKEEKEILNSKEYNNFKEVINKEFL